MRSLYCDVSDVAQPEKVLTFNGGSPEQTSNGGKVAGANPSHRPVFTYCKHRCIMPKLKIIVENRQPKVGIFWIINDQIVSFTEDARTVRIINGFKDTDMDHYHMWPKLKIRGDYTNKPRGRVIYRAKDDKYMVYVPSSLTDDKRMLLKILREFSIPTSKFVIVTDEHYEMDELSAFY